MHLSHELLPTLSETSPAESRCRATRKSLECLDKSIELAVRCTRHLAFWHSGQKISSHRRKQLYLDEFLLRPPYLALTDIQTAILWPAPARSTIPYGRVALTDIQTDIHTSTSSCSVHQKTYRDHLLLCPPYLTATSPWQTYRQTQIQWFHFHITILANSCSLLTNHMSGAHRQRKHMFT